jgi:hypothetical protein
MNFTQSQIDQIKQKTLSINLPLLIEEVTNYNIKIKMYGNEQIYLNISSIMGLRLDGFNSDGTYYSYDHDDFNQILYNLGNWIKKVKSDNPRIIDQNKQIEKIAPKFYQIYCEAKLISHLNLKESACMIFRKSLEILIKDYLIYILPSYEKLIIEKMIGPIVLNFYNVDGDDLKLNEKIEFDEIKTELLKLLPLIQFVNKTFKIGNDFSHYERKFEKISPQDFEINIEKILNYLIGRLEIDLKLVQSDETDKEFKEFKLTSTIKKN